jgi:hypothetical protein
VAHLNRQPSLAMRENLQLCERERALWRTKDLAVIVTASSGEEINSKQLASKLQQWRALGHPCMVLHKNPLQVGRSVVACDLTSHPCQSPSLGEPLYLLSPTAIRIISFPDTSSSTRGASAAIVLGDDIPPQGNLNSCFRLVLSCHLIIYSQPCTAPVSHAIISCGSL